MRIWKVMLFGLFLPMLFSLSIEYAIYSNNTLFLVINSSKGDILNITGNFTNKTLPKVLNESLLNLRNYIVEENGRVMLNYNGKGYLALENNGTINIKELLGKKLYVISDGKILEYTIDKIPYKILLKNEIKKKVIFGVGLAILLLLLL